MGTIDHANRSTIGGRADGTPQVAIIEIVAQQHNITGQVYAITHIVSSRNQVAGHRHIGGGRHRTHRGVTGIADLQQGVSRDRRHRHFEVLEPTAVITSGDQTRVAKIFTDVMRHLDVLHRTRKTPFTLVVG